VVSSLQAGIVGLPNVGKVSMLLCHKLLCLPDSSCQGASLGEAILHLQRERAHHRKRNARRKLLMSCMLCGSSRAQMTQERHCHVCVWSPRPQLF